ncbi:quinone oxidoreductase family protein [Saccharothrix violaceirubra]|uniref:NADPH2:quinone reductase n=1 Tax=Saccharothrix violaceirubra TaxID=413306 RepID=A0A7W7WUB5_9PSEU|nr:zinc-binding dehydrogenase [Saccharothrix violaceirubra]MBB4964006.1 NADPH2:quinone reductase [Saccharothrix violaceirubra]
MTADGRRLAGVPTGPGYASHAVLTEPVEVPDTLSDHEAAALLSQGTTALAAARAGRIAPGDRVLVEAATGGVGSLLVQLASRAGAIVVAATRGAHKLAIASQLGAHEVVDYSVPGWSAGLEPIDVALSSVGGATARESFDLLRTGTGRLVLFGYAGGAPLDVDASDVFGRGVSITGLWGTYSTDAVREAFASGLSPILGAALPLSDAARAHYLLESRSTTGKLILVP